MCKHPVLIQSMQPSDIESVYALQTVLRFQEWSKDSIYKQLELSSNIALVSKDSQQHLHGYCFVQCTQYEAELLSIAVSPHKQGQGLGYALLQAVLQKLPPSHKLFLEVRESNSPAIHLYEKFGFICYSTRKKYYSNGETALLMSKQL
jgi:[ribosomal protein S18]-alanine N-acetyltransferase